MPRAGRLGVLVALCQMCGWSDYAMVEKVYGHLAPDYLKAEIVKMDGAAGEIG